MNAPVLSAISAELNLIAKVAVARAQSEAADSTTQKSLFRIVGFDPAVTSSIAKTFAAIKGAEVHVHDDLNDGSLPPELLTTKSATFFRNAERSAGGGLIVFAVPTDHLDVVGATVGEIKQISQESLCAAPDLWFDCCPELSSMEARMRQYVRNAVLGAISAGVLTDGINMMARFMLLLNQKYKAVAIERALDEALPAFRIPAGAGRFKDIGAKGRLKSKEAWSSEFVTLHERAEDALYLRNDRGAPLDREIIRKRLPVLVGEAKITQEEADIFGDLLDDTTLQAGRWRPSQDAATQLRWDVVERILKATRETKKPKLGEATAEFFKTNMPKVLDQADKTLLDALTGTGEADEQEREFFFRYREQLQEDKKILKQWEAFVFNKIGTHPDLLSGLLLSAADLIRDAESLPANPKLVIRLDGSDKLAFWKARNTDIVTFLRDRYRGLSELLAPVVGIDFGICWTHSIDRTKGRDRSSTAARTFKFDISLVSADDPPGKLPANSTQLTWLLPANSFANAYSENMLEVARTEGESPAPRALLARGRFSRAQNTQRAIDGIIDLEDRSTVQDAFDNPDGRLVDVNARELDMGASFEGALTGLSGTLLDSSVVTEIRAAFDAFHVSYSAAVRAFIKDDGKGLTEPALIEQSVLYGKLLALLREKARKDECRSKLWEPILSIGMARSIDKPSVSISCPWHPFRLAEAHAKALRLANAFKALIEAGGSGTDLRTFAKEVTASVDRGWHPALSIAPDTPRPRLLIETENFADFGLLEPPTADEGAEGAFDGYSKEATAEFLNVAQEYLDLNPHERANFSIVLYNADNRDLPSRLADQLARKIEAETDLRCDLVLTHTDQNRLRQIYSEQNVTISREMDGVLATEAAQTFLSRLRVGFLDVDSVKRGAPEGRSSDMVFLHDVIARNAHASWRKCVPPLGGWPSFLDHVPDAETRRQSFEVGARKTEVLLIPSERPVEVQHYVDLIHDLHRDHRDTSLDHFVPVREVSFDEDTVKNAIEQAHAVATWVVTYDGIADLQLLRNNGVQIVRFITRPGSSHNLVVSTKQNSKTLRQRLTGIIGPIVGGVGEPIDMLSNTCIDHAAHISGRVVLRAARLERNALELLGLVLSRQIITDSLPQGMLPVCWLLLDDFADWLGHKGKKADILLLCIGEQNGKPVLDLIIVEAKFVGKDADAAEAKSSLEQTQASTNDLRDRVIQDEDHLNKATWRGRLADLLLEHGLFRQRVGERSPKEWASLLRTGSADIRIRGASMVFVHDCTDTKIEPLEADSAEQRQYVFDRAEIARTLRRITDPTIAPLTIALPVPVSNQPAGDGVAKESVPAQEAAVVEVATATKPEGTSQLAEGAKHAPVVDEQPQPVRGGPGLYPPSVIEFIESKKPETDDHATLQWLEATKTKLRTALRGYGLAAEIIGDRLTPNAALVRLKGSDNLTVADLEKRKGVLLTTHQLDVIDIRPGSGEVVVTISRPKRAKLTLEDLWRRRKLPNSAPMQNGSFLIGEKEQDGELLYLNLFEEFNGQPQHGPHTLIAGESGGGKGILTRNLLLDLLATNSPQNARVRFVDPKFGGDYRWIDQMPHLDGGIVSTQSEAIETLKDLVDEMDRRYVEITKVASNIDKFNAKVPPEARLPRIFLFHDEIGDWLADSSSDYRDAVENYVVRLASKARAAGIHLFMITQRPDKDAMPGQVKANLGNKICLKVSTASNSRIVLDESGGENLLGHGHFIAKLANERVSNQSSLIYGQVPFADEDEAFDLAMAIKAHWK
ncbi:DNA translocase FtsK [Bosea sp. F3-2]|uniref:FtsK/SpoIIIE domain-containing protein n=1 Tax=Bosea sp. F3-2 TaxID=2599640 RepID=UPI0011EBAA54|nr:FtsK/SpoIIIE domain-containing protein [Bosea sp. F3-2]QEL21915.1 DNA translocase FtsK [Bosea sp. F3-2]